MKSIAMDMDLGQSTLSRKLSPGAGDTSRLNVDDLESYMSVTGDLRPLAYMAAKFGQSDDDRRHHAIANIEQMMLDLQHQIKTLGGGK